MPRYKDNDFLHSSVKFEPYWWEEFRPVDCIASTLPAQVDVAIIGGGYGGLGAARMLSDLGFSSVVLESGQFGSGASTRSGGAISAGLSIGKSFTGRSLGFPQEIVSTIVQWAKDAFIHVQELVEQEGIACHFEKRGRFLGACAPSHYEALRDRESKLKASGVSGCYLVPREQQANEINSDYYHGGMVFDDAGKLHPALFYGGLLDACRRRNSIVLSSQNRALSLQHRGAGWEVQSEQGVVRARHVFVATNGYTGPLVPPLRRRLIPVASNVIATEELPPDLAAFISPKGRTFSETRRLMHYYRISPDGKRVIFGGRTRFRHVPQEEHARILHAELTRRFPVLREIKVTHAWQGNVAFTSDSLPHAGELGGIHYAVGCNGSGVSMMPFLGAMVAMRIAGRLHGRLPFGDLQMRAFPMYNGVPWFLPAAEGYFRVMDFLDERVGR